MRCEENQNVQMDISSLQSRAENLKKSRKKKKRKIDSYDFNVCDDIATTKDWTTVMTRLPTEAKVQRESVSNRWWKMKNSNVKWRYVRHGPRIERFERENNIPTIFS
jgi:hypothetical protein